MTGLGDEIAVVEAPEKRMVGQGEIVLVNAEELPWKDSLFYPIVPIQPRLGGPAEWRVENTWLSAQLKYFSISGQ